MKLFLSSEGIPRPDLLKKLLGTYNKKPTVALINNAQDPYPYLLAKASETALTAAFSSLGFHTILIDLRLYKEKTQELTDELRNCNLIWCSGGNSFWLRYVMKESGFDTLLPTLLAEGLVYGGWSAGAVVAGPSLHPIELMDDPNKAPEIVWDGLGITDCFVWPHWDKEKYLHLQVSAAEQMKLLPHDSVILRDGEVLIIENEKREVFR